MTHEEIEVENLEPPLYPLADPDAPEHHDPESHEHDEEGGD